MLYDTIGQWAATACAIVAFVLILIILAGAAVITWKTALRDD